MNKYGQLLQTVSYDMNINKGDSESENQWKKRLLFSAAGHNALSSVWDVGDDDESASVAHLKARTIEYINSLLSMYPELSFASTAAELAETIYNTLLLSGCIYHEPHRISPCIFRHSTLRNIEFVRGEYIETIYRSGIGAYKFTDESDDISNVLSMFAINRNTLREEYEIISNQFEFRRETIPNNAEFLKMEPPYNKGYFVNNPYSDGRISLLRAGNPGNRIYFLYMIKGGNSYLMQLASWMNEDYQYRNISNQLLNNIGALIPTAFHDDGEIVEIRINYLYPPAEQNLLRLYSWPKSYSYPAGDFNRIMSKSVFSAIKELFELRGFSFVEE